MASDLSVELLEIVGKCLNFTNDVSRFRAVCQSWRSSVSPFTKSRQQLLSPIRGPIQLPKHSDSNGNWPKIMTLTKGVIYHVTHSSGTWIVTVKLNESDEIVRRLDPLFRCPFSCEQLPETFPEALNLLDEDVRVVEMAEAYSLKDISETGRDYRVAVSFNPSCPVLMVIVNGVLYYCNIGDDPIPMLKPVEGLSEFIRLEDVIYYEEKFYAGFVFFAGDGYTCEDSDVRFIPNFVCPPSYRNPRHQSSPRPPGMADRDLPDELIERIREHLDLKTRMHVAQFRAVSQSWRSSIPSFNPLEPPPQDHPLDLLPSTFAIFFPLSDFPYTIQRSIIYHIAPYPAPHHKDERKRGWLMRMDTNQKLLPPLSWRDSGLEKPKRVMMNSVDFGVLEVAKPYLLVSMYDNDKYHKLAVSLYFEFFPAVMLVTCGAIFLGKLSCQVSKSGKAAAMDSSFKWEVIASPVSTSMLWKKKKFLVESLGELLLVERHGSTYVASCCSEEDMLRKEIKFKVYKLDAYRKQWVEMEGSDLDGRILCVGEVCCFSVSSRDFPGCQGNFVYFSYEVWRAKTIFSKIGVFHLDDGSASPLEAGANIFLPPP
ncbi:hypothetical protein ACLB2K_000868 [Fragaria x ananassa]